MKFNEIIDTKILPVMTAIGQQRHLLAVRDGVIVNLVPSMVGSLFLLFAALPIPGYGDFIRSIGLFDALLIPISATLGLMGLIAVVTISYRLAESYGIDSLFASVIAVLAFFMLTPFHIPHELVEGGIGNVVPLTYLGSAGLFSAIIVAIVSTEIFRRLVATNFIIRMPEGVPPAVAKSFAALVPGGLTLIVFWVLRLLIDASAFENIHSIVADLMTTPLSYVGDSIWGAIGFMFLVHFFWFFGIHGQLVVGSILDPVFVLLQDQNRIAFQAGQELPHIITRYWFDLYVTLGGAGATLPIVVALALVARSVHLKTVGRLALAPGIFNINEPFTFGVPVVFNPIVIIPWIFVPIMNICTAYFATIIDFLPRHNGIVAPWTTPIFISGLIVAGWKGVAMQAINFSLDLAVWYLFMKRIDNTEYKKELDGLN